MGSNSPYYSQVVENAEQSELLITFLIEFIGKIYQFCLKKTDLFLSRLNEIVLEDITQEKILILT